MGFNQWFYSIKTDKQCATVAQTVAKWDTIPDRAREARMKRLQ